MDVLEVLHVLADHEQVILPFVNHFEFLDGLACTRVKDAKHQLCLLAGLHYGRNRPEVQSVIADVERRSTNKVHAAAWTFAGDVHGVVAMHRAHPRGVVFGLLRDQRNHRGTEYTEAKGEKNSHLTMWTGGVALVDTGTWTGQFVTARTRIPCHVESGVVIGPVDQSILEYRVSPRDPLWKRHRIADLPWTLRNGNIVRAQSVRVPRVEHQVFENRRIVILLRTSPATLAVGFRDVLSQAFVDLIIGNGEGTNHDRYDLRFHRDDSCAIQWTTTVLI